jgi:hypothetical protein
MEAIVFATTLGLALTGLVFCAYMLWRNEWVYKIRLGHIGRVYAWVRAEKTYDYERMERAYDCLGDYDSWFRLSKIFDFDRRSFITDREAYEWVYGPAAPSEAPHGK